jgi:hypothetical protein
MIEKIIGWLDTQYIDFVIFWLVIASGFFQERYLRPWRWYRSDARYDATLKTFVVSLILCGVYTWLAKYEAGIATEAEQQQGLPWAKLFISFALATSFYDLIIRLFKMEWKKKTGIDADSPDIQKPKTDTNDG